MLYKDLSTKELYASIPATSVIAQLFKTGLEIGSTQLAVSAMEELIVREDYDIITAVLQSAADTRKLILGTSLASMIGRSLKESCYHDPLLQKYGIALLKGEGEDGPFKWVKSGKAAKYFNRGKEYVRLRNDIEARHKAATAAYLKGHSERLRKIFDATNLASMECTAPEGAAPIDEEWVLEALREVLNG